MPLFEEEFTVEAAPETVWDFLLDPQRVAPCLPGCESVEIESATTYKVRLTVKVGFLSTTQNLKVELVESDRPRHLVSVARGEDRKLASQVEVRNTLDLAPASPGHTLVRYRSDVRVLGRLGSVGDAVMKVKAKQVAADFAANVRAAIGRPA
jgi:carbon monoxide dehydrogenase subunit G